MTDLGGGRTVSKEKVGRLGIWQVCNDFNFFPNNFDCTHSNNTFTESDRQVLVVVVVVALYIHRLTKAVVLFQEYTDRKTTINPIFHGYSVVSDH
ncbi:hypothetical protein GJ496_003824 [Pomphorhynchus laevis]|nr:hypothetical protein GJ496_003824 [Pomphorhynchus laevis]